MAYYGEEGGTIPTPDERLLGDYLSPVRPFSMTNVVNTVSKELGTDVAEWSVKRLLSMVGLIRHSKQQRQDALQE